MSQKPVDWKLTNVDTGQVFLPQFPISDDTGVTGGGGSTLGERSRFGNSPLLQWLGSQTESFTFSTELHAEDANDDIQPKADQLRALSQKDDRLGRIPVCLFHYGLSITEYVLVESALPTYRGTLRNGNPRHILFNVTLKKYTPFYLVSTDPTRPVKESYHPVASAAEASYEAIAARFYGDPLLGDRLRKRHPESPTAPTLGQKVKIPRREIVARETIEPSCHVFNRDDTDTQTAYQAITEARGAPVIVSTL